MLIVVSNDKVNQFVNPQQSEQTHSYQHYNPLLSLDSYFAIFLHIRLNVPIEKPVMATVLDIILTVIILCILWFAKTAIVRLYLHPLSKFPGPRAAALSRWYEIYYDVIQRGRWIKQFPELHEQYGTTTV